MTTAALKRAMRTRLIVMTGSIACILMSGCMSPSMSTHTGTPLDPNAVSTIRKGVTTRAEVESLLGPPSTVAMMESGKRMMGYSYSDSNSEGDGVAKASGALSGLSMLGALAGIPVSTVGLGVGTAGGMAGGRNVQMRTQSLKIVINANNIVEDYELTDTAMQTESGPGGSRQSITSDSSSGGSGSLGGGSQSGGTSSVAAVDPAEKLKTLKELRDAGVLTEEEYQAKRKDIIERL